MTFEFGDVVQYDGVTGMVLGLAEANGTIYDAKADMDATIDVGDLLIVMLTPMPDREGWDVYTDWERDVNKIDWPPSKEEA